MDQMTAMMLERIHDLRRTDAPLVCRQVPVPQPGDHEILIRVTACGVCHTELDEIEGRTPPPEFPVVPGHEVVGGWPVGEPVPGDFPAVSGSGWPGSTAPVAAAGSAGRDWRTFALNLPPPEGTPMAGTPSI